MGPIGTRHRHSEAGPCVVDQRADVQWEVVTQARKSGTQRRGSENRNHQMKVRAEEEDRRQKRSGVRTQRWGLRALGEEGGRELEEARPRQ